MASSFSPDKNKDSGFGFDPQQVQAGRRCTVDGQHAYDPDNPGRTLQFPQLLMLRKNGSEISGENEIPNSRFLSYLCLSLSLSSLFAFACSFVSLSLNPIHPSIRLSSIWSSRVAERSNNLVH